MRRAWPPDPVTFAGRYVSVRDIHVLPKPVRPGGIPVWVGGHTDAALRRTATLGGGRDPDWDALLDPAGARGLRDERATHSHAGPRGRTRSEGDHAVAARADGG